MIETAILLERLWQISSFPFNNPELIPSLIPVFVGFIVLELYFGRYEYEELGWNTAVGNATMLVTTGLTLIYDLQLYLDFSSQKSIVAYSILTIGLLMLILNFYHLWPKKIAFNISSATVIYLLGYLGISLTYGQIPLDQNTLISAGAFSLSIIILFTIIQKLETTVIG